MLFVSLMQHLRDAMLERYVEVNDCNEVRTWLLKAGRIAAPFIFARGLGSGSRSWDPHPPSSGRKRHGHSEARNAHIALTTNMRI